jgi:hypothetical protein
MPLLELFSPALRRKTWLLFLLVALNFFAYQAFAGWTTTFLKDDRGLSSEAIGWIVSTQFTGALIGGFFWGWFSDRYGRRPTGDRLRARRAFGARLCDDRAIADGVRSGGLLLGLCDHRVGRLGAVDVGALPGTGAIVGDVDLQLGADRLDDRAAGDRPDRRELRPRSGHVARRRRLRPWRAVWFALPETVPERSAAACECNARCRLGMNRS